MSVQFKEKAAKLLRTSTIAQSFPRPDKVITIDSKSKLYAGFQTLLESNVLSAPVWDSTTNKYIGFLDIRDLVAFVVFVYDNQKVKDNSRLEDLILHGVGQFTTATTDGVSVSYLSRRHKFVTVKETDTLEQATRVLSDQAIHRVPVVDEAGQLVNIISQSSLIQIISQYCVDITVDEPDLAISDLPSVGSTPVLSVNKSESVINTFRILDLKNKSGIALIDNNGRLVGTTTGKDLGLFLKNPTLDTLNLPIFEHLQKIRAELIDIKTPCISVFPQDKLSRAVALLAATRVHRVFVVSDETHYHPIKVISITDILNYLIR
jgi:5'-AMP-activated protein kinase regulatory gamma subunit